MVDWNRKYRDSPVPLFGTEPNEYLRQALARSDLAVASALCLGDGDGRNGGWLAERGVRVTAVDISAVATDQARARDTARGVAVARLVADLADWEPPPGAAWDAVVVLYLQCERDVRRRALERAAAALTPGGWVVAEGFTPGAQDDSFLGPRQPDILYDLADLTAALPGFRVIEAFTGTTWLEEGERHRGPARVARLLARKPF
ncbi:MAG: class I SAM-dependent methyltransferase [Hyphomicrobiales bacterium]|nr:class I SAM-dependent methyltransferase [Hyphomicrobiales bacterium]